MSKGLYIHIPFCVRKCPYCDFYSVTDRGLQTAYVDAVIEEIRELKDIDTVFIGGGTPTSVGSELVRLCEAVPKAGEFTVEANPGTVDLPLLKALRNAGVNRLSFGVQSFNDNELRALGRIHTAAQAEESFYMAREAGFDNISLDLMLSTPFQTAESVKNSLEKIRKLRPEHVSAYSLIIEEGTPFYDAELELPGEDEEREIYYLTRAFLEDMGLKQYEISNFALPGRECRHNIKYWTLEPYVGVGAAAHSYNEGCRYYSSPDIKAYIDGSGRGLEREFVSEDERLREKFWLGLRMTGGIIYKGEFPDKVEKLIRHGLLERSGENIRLTKRGTDLANTVFMEFV